MLPVAGKTFTAWAWKYLEDGFLKFNDGREVETHLKFNCPANILHYILYNGI